MYLSGWIPRGIVNTLLGITEVATAPPDAVHPAARRPRVSEPPRPTPTLYPSLTPDVQQTKLNPKAPAPQVQTAAQSVSNGRRVRRKSAEAPATVDDVNASLKKLSVGASKKDQPIHVKVKGLSPDITLHKHQIAAREFLRDQEASSDRGSILTDDMGLGKTITVIVQILDSKYLLMEKGPTLVVTPKAIITQWKEEIERCAPGLRVIVHTGESRTRDAMVFDKYDVVLTTYGLVRSEHKNFLAAKEDQSQGRRLVGQKKPRTALLDAKFLRIVMDEGHETRNPETQLSQACNDLNAKYRIIMTGTPIHNKYGDIFSYFNFLRIAPFNDLKYFTEMEALDREKLHAEFCRIMLRRMKSDIVDGEPIVSLPPSEVIVEDLKLNPEERDLYDDMLSRIWYTINKYIPDEHSLKRYTCAFVMLLRLRQATTHPWLCIWETPLMEEKIDEADLGEHCHICMAPLESGAGSVFCIHCRQNIVPKIRKLKQKRSSNPLGSSKTDRMLEILRQVRTESNGVDKTVVFSQWTSLFDILEDILKNAGFQYVRYDGSMKVDAKEAVLKTFKTDPKVTVMFVSFKAGGVGLNLTAVNNIILMDLWWNPAMEEQAFDRIRRIGQTKPVKVYKLVVPDTIEVRVVELQNEKKALANDIFIGTNLQKTGRGLGFDAIVEVIRSSRPRV